MNYKNIGSCIFFAGIFGLSLSGSACGDEDKNEKKKTKKEAVDQFYKHMCDLGFMKKDTDEKDNVKYVLVPGAKEAVAYLLSYCKALNEKTPDVLDKGFKPQWGLEKELKCPIVSSIIVNS